MFPKIPLLLLFLFCLGFGSVLSAQETHTKPLHELSRSEWRSLLAAEPDPEIQKKMDKISRNRTANFSLVTLSVSTAVIGYLGGSLGSKNWEFYSSYLYGLSGGLATVAGLLALRNQYLMHQAKKIYLKGLRLQPVLGFNGQGVPSLGISLSF